MPTRYSAKRPITENIKRFLIEGFFLVPNQIIKESKRNPKVYPPVAPNRKPMPPENEEKTGSPTAPNKRYIPTLKVPSFPPSKPRVVIIAIVCKVKGIGEGIVIQEQIAIKAEKSATYIIWSIDSLFSLIKSPLSILIIYYAKGKSQSRLFFNKYFPHTQYNKGKAKKFA